MSLIKYFCETAYQQYLQAAVLTISPHQVTLKHRITILPTEKMREVLPKITLPPPCPVDRPLYHGWTKASVHVFPTVQAIHSVVAFPGKSLFMPDSSGAFIKAFI